MRVKAFAELKGLELNISGFRQEPHEGYPGTSILMLYHRLGGDIITVGSDSHARHDVGADFDLALQCLKQCGFHYITSYTRRTPSFIPI